MEVKKISEDNSKKREEIIDSIHKYMDTITDPTIKAFWAYNIWTHEGVKINAQSLNQSRFIAKFAFGVGITSLAASLISLGISLLNYGT